MPNQAEFIEKHAPSGDLSPEQMAEFLTLPEGEITFVAPTDASGPPPAPAPVAAAPEPAPAPPAPAAPTPAPEPPVLLSRDGQHTIPFSVLEAERAKVRELQALADQLRASAAPASTPAAPAPQAPAPAMPDVNALVEGVDFGDFGDDAIKRATAQIALKAAHAAMAAQPQAPAQPAVAAPVAAPAPVALTPEQQRAAAVQAHFAALEAAHPGYADLPLTREFQAWRATLPIREQRGVDLVLREGETQEVIGLFNDFKASTGVKPPASAPAAPAAAPSATAAELAAKAIADAQANPKPPTSLSEIPAGSAAHVEPGAALMDASPQALVDMFLAKSPEQVEALIRRVV